MTTTQGPTGVPADRLGYQRMEGLADTRRVASGRTTSDLTGLLARRTALVLASLALLGWVSSRWTPLSWLPPAALAVLALILLGRALRIEAPGHRNPVLPFSIGLVVGAVALWALYRWVLPMPWLLLAAASLLFVGVAGVGSRLRYLWRTSWVPPVAFGGLAVGLSVAGAVLASTTDSRWPIYLYVASIGAGYLALVFGTEPWILASGSPVRSIAVLLAAALLVGIAVAWLATLGAGLGYAAAVVGVVAVLTLSITLDGDGEIFIVLLLLALVWAVIPRSVDRVPIEEQIVGNHPIVIALGDSYMSGEGAERYVDGTNTRDENLCRRAPTAWSQLVSEPTVAISIACSGATIGNVSGRAQYTGEPIDWPNDVGVPDGADQLTQLAWLLDAIGEDRIERVAITVGGNNAGFARAGITCIGPGDCSELEPVWFADFAALEPRLTSLYREIRATMDEGGASDVPLVVTGYPVPVGEEGCGWTLLSESEHVFVTRFVGLLNARVEAAAEAAGASYVHTIPSSLEAQGLRLCEAGPRQAGLNFLEFSPQEGTLLQALDPRNWVNNSFHPNEEGHLALADAVDRWEAGEPAPPPPDAFPDPGDPPCDGREACSAFADAWGRSKIAELFRRVSVPVILAFVGSWLLATRLVASFRNRRFRLFGPLIELAERVL